MEISVWDELCNLQRRDKELQHGAGGNSAGCDGIKTTNDKDYFNISSLDGDKFNIQKSKIKIAVIDGMDKQFNH